MRRVLRLPDGFIVHSSSLIEELRQFNSEAPVEWVLHPVYDFYRQWDPGPQEKEETTTRFLFFGKVREYKGLEVLLEAVALATKEVSLNLTIAGDFYLGQDELREQARRLGVDPYIDWLPGYISNRQVALLFRETDAVVLPYSRATQSGVVAVAYHFEVPVIASAAGGLPEMVEDGKTGFLFPPGDAAALSRTLVKFVGQTDTGNIKEEIRRFRKKMTWEQVVQAVHRLSATIDSPTNHAN